MRCDLLIVGAGPAGCAAAVAAKRAAPRLQVLVIDARPPGGRRCAGVLTGGGLRELELAGLILRIPHALADSAVVRSQRMVSRIALSHSAVVVRGSEFEADLAAQARAVGAAFLEGTTLERIEGKVAWTAQGPISFEALIGADGVHSVARRVLGLQQGLRIAMSERQVATAAQWELVFDLDPGVPGCAWRFPSIDGGAARWTGAEAAETYGVFSWASRAETEEALEAFAEREGLPDGAAGRSAIRIFDSRGSFGAEGALLAGEALGEDPLIGDGVRYALWSGRIAGALAARALSRGRMLSVARYRAELLGSRSGILLELSVHLAKALYSADARWRRVASDGGVARDFAALISGEPPVAPILGLIRHFPTALMAAQSA